MSKTYFYKSKTFLNKVYNKFNYFNLFSLFTYPLLLINSCYCNNNEGNLTYKQYLQNTLNLDENDLFSRDNQFYFINNYPHKNPKTYFKSSYYESSQELNLEINLIKEYFFYLLMILIVIFSFLGLVYWI